MRSIKLELGGKEYVISEAPRKRSKPFREKLAAEILPIFEQVAKASTAEFSTAADLIQLAPVVQYLIADAIDTLLDLLFIYSEALEADRARLEDDITDGEIMMAFVEVIRLSDPLGFMQRLNLAAATTGQPVTPISKS
jgi:hypothetical protein